MLRDNFDRLRDTSRDERERRDTRSYYLTDDESELIDNLRSQEYSRRPGALSNFSQRLKHDSDEPRIDEARLPENDYRRQPVRNRGNDSQTPRRGSNDFGNANDAVNYSTDDAHHWTGGYDAKEANPYYPLTNRIVEKNEQPQRREFVERDARAQNFIARDQSQSREYKQNRDYVQERGYNDVRARDVMSRNVATVQPNDAVQHAARLMRDTDCGAIPVVNRNGQMIGMITDRDITVRLVASGSDPRAAGVQSCMTTKVFACHENDSLDAAVKEMARYQIRRIPIVDNQNRIVGIVSQSDLARRAGRHQDEYDEFGRLLNNISERSSGEYR